MPNNEAERRREYIDNASQLITYSSLPPRPPRTHRDFNPLYEDQSFVNWFNWFPQIHQLPRDQIAVVASYEFRSNREISGWGYNQIQRVHLVFYWIVKAWPSVNSFDSIQERYDHFRGVRSNNPYLNGSCHTNRFIRGTKLLITRGEFQGKHCVVVGHRNSSSTLNDSPVLRVLLADLAIVSVIQSNTRLLDLHGYLPFGIPFDPSQLTDWNWGGSHNFWDHRYLGPAGWGR